MTVLLVLATFLVLIVLDYALNRRTVMATVPIETGNAMTPATTAPAGDFVGGFHTPDNLSYHPGHSWLVRERKNVVRIGADEFAGGADAIRGAREAVGGRHRRPDPAQHAVRHAA